MSNLRKLYLPNELGDLCFSLHISSHHNVENNREKFKENLTTTSITKESPYLGQSRIMFTVGNADRYIDRYVEIITKARKRNHVFRSRVGLSAPMNTEKWIVVF